MEHALQYNSLGRQGAFNRLNLFTQLLFFKRLCHEMEGLNFQSGLSCYKLMVSNVFKQLFVVLHKYKLLGFFYKIDH
jgi:hypothetical protein